MADQTNVLEVLLVQCDLRVVAVGIIQPDLPVVDYVARLLMAQLTDPAVDSCPLIYIGLPGT
jgi:hypothetical protein